MSHYTGPYVLQINGQPVWYAALDGVPIKAEFNSRGAALAAIEVERKRREKHTQKGEKR